MNIIEEIEAKYKQAPGYGIQFSIEPEAYDCDIPNDRLTFGENTTELQCGTFYNWQPVLLDGELVGWLQETQSGRIFDPTTVSFILVIADCMHHDLWQDMLAKHAGDPHLYDAGESLELRFATLQQFIDYLRKNNTIC